MELAAQEPSQITVTVFSARNLQSKRKGEICHASVVFGLGKDYYRTEVLESNNPEWNQEAHIPVPSRIHGSIKFKVRDKDHTLGVVTVSLAELSGHQHKQWLPLQPHKKSHEAHGDLLLSSWVSEYRAALPERASPATSQGVSPSTSITSSMEDLHAAGGRGHKMFSFHRRAPSWSKTKPEKDSPLFDPALHPPAPSQENAPRAPRGAVLRTTGSEYELHSQRVLRTCQSDTNLKSLPQDGRAGSGEQPLVDNSMDTTLDSLIPEVTGISPNEGPVKGGQRVILRGSNLGESKEDVVRVVLAGVNCTTTLEYFSPAKLVVTTLPRGSPGGGSVVVETLGGGKGVSSIKFTFVEHQTVRVGSVGEGHSPFVKRKTRETEELQAEVKALKQQVRDLKSDNAQLKEENASLRGYIDRLLLVIIDQSPDVLEVKAAMPSGRHSSFTQ